MKAAIRNRLQQTPQEHEMMIFSMYNKWCNEKTEGRKSLQKALTNRPLFNWWQAELAKYERRFLEETEAYANTMDRSTARIYYAETIIPVFKHFPRPLMPKNQITNN